MIKQKIYKRLIISILFILIACYSAAIIGVVYTHAEINVEENQNTVSEGAAVEPYIYTPENNYGAVNLGGQRIKEGEHKTANLYYIKNANYFLANPKHHNNDGSDNETGTCTTVATQMLLGYHNYYSDRRLIPETDENGVRFLSEDYSDLEQHPDIMLVGDEEDDLGRASIGTENTVYSKYLR